MKKLNLPLIIGLIILALLLVIIIFPGLFTDKSPYNMQKIIFSRPDGHLEIEKAPFPPSKDFIMGSDDLGRDIFSLIIHGTGLTLLLGVLIAIGRFIIAFPMAISAGFGNNLSKNIIRQFGVLFSAIPALLISVIILKLDFFAGLDKGSSIAAFVIVLSLTGWPKLGSLLMERVEGINSRPFIKGEVAMGKSRLRIAIENVFPHLAPETTVLFFMEISRALSMVMQLGLFSVYVGLLKIIWDTEGGVQFVDVSFEPEWASMLASSRSFVTVAPWMVLFPAIAFFISVLGFNLFGEGLRNNLQKRDSLFIPKTRKLMTLKLRDIGAGMGSKQKITAAIIATVVTISVLWAALAGGNRYSFDKYEGSLPEYDRVIAGSREAGETALFIAGRMEELGLEVLDDEYIMDYGFPESCMVTEHSLSTSTPGLSYEYGVDYEFSVAVEGIFEGLVYDASYDDLFSLVEYEKFSGKFVMIDKSFYNDSALNYFAHKIADETNIKGIILVNRVYETIEGLLAREGTDYPIIQVTQEFARILRENPDSVLTVSSAIEGMGATGSNVFGILRGVDEHLYDEAIVIGMGYNYLNEEGKEILGFNLKLMEEICSLEQNSRSLIFMFIDGTYSESSNGIYGVAEDFPYSTSKVKTFIDLSGLKTTGYEDALLARKQSPYTRPYAWSLAEQIEKELSSRKIDCKEPESVNYNGEFYYTDNYASNTMFWDNGIASLRIVTGRPGDSHDIYDLGEIILKTISNNNY
ncbi:MAG: ABC transporter permease subunit [Clostridia bacterium]|nr:ABC transporter permease subunit [Clostridia bacterium]